MPAKSKPTFIAVMDSNEARFFVLRRSEEGQIFEDTGSVLVAKRVMRSDRPGRGPSAVRGGRNAGELKKDTVNTTQLIRDVTQALETGFSEKRFEQLVLVAPARPLAQLRAALSPKVAGSVVHQIAKNLTGMSTDALWRKLSDTLLKDAKPMMASARETKTAEAGLPVSVVFRNMAASAAAQAEAVKLATKLGRRFGGIVNCRVTVEAPKHAHRKVKEFRVGIAMKLPGREIATKAGEGEAHSDLSLAMREAFAGAMRQLDGQVRKVKDGMLRMRRREAPRLKSYAGA